MDLSIVTTLYRSSPYLREFCRRASETADKLGLRDHEIVLVNDGSPDDSLDVAIALRQEDPRRIIVDLSRNFGHHKAMMTGLMHARGDRVFLIDCDLEEPPEILETFLSRMQQYQADVVYGQQEFRKGGWFERASGYCFYRVLNWLSNYPLPSNVTTARLMSRRYVQSLIQHRDQEVFMLGLWAITGFKQVPVPVQKQSKGKSTYTLGRKLALCVNAVTSFSNKPLLYISYLGAVISALSFGAACYLLIQKLLFSDYLAGWPSLIVSIWFLGGLTIFCLGVIGIYLAKVFSETKDRPYTVVRQIYGPAEEANS